MDTTAITALFSSVADDVTALIPGIAGAALAVFGLIFVIKRGKSLFSGLAKG